MKSMIFPGANALPYYPLFLSMNHVQEPVERPFGVNCFQWVQCVSGTGLLTLFQKQYLLHPGDGIFLRENIPHGYHAINDNLIVNFYGFAGAGIADILRDSSLENSGVYHLVDPEAIIKLQEQFFASYNNDCQLQARDYIDSSYVYQILMNLLTQTTPSANLHLLHENPFSETLEYIRQHIEEPLTIDLLAGLNGLTREYFCTKFKSITGMTAMTYLNKLRLQRSTELLMSGPMCSVAQIAKLCGFESSSYYIATFKKSFGMSPGAFRKTFFQQSAPASRHTCHE